MIGGGMKQETVPIGRPPSDESSTNEEQDRAELSHTSFESNDPANSESLSRGNLYTSATTRPVFRSANAPDQESYYESGSYSTDSTYHSVALNSGPSFEERSFSTESSMQQSSFARVESLLSGFESEDDNESVRQFLQDSGVQTIDDTEIQRFSDSILDTPDVQKSSGGLDEPVSCIEEQHPASIYQHPATPFPVEGGNSMLSSNSRGRVEGGSSSEAVKISATNNRTVVADHKDGWLLTTSEMKEMDGLLELAAQEKDYDPDRLYELSLVYRWMCGEPLDADETQDVAYFRVVRQRDWNYHQELKRLVKKAKAGLFVDRSYFYGLQLYERRNLGEKLTEEEYEHLEEFERAEGILQDDYISKSSSNGDFSGEEPPEVAEAVESQSAVSQDSYVMVEKHPIAAKLPQDIALNPTAHLLNNDVSVAASRSDFLPIVKDEAVAADRREGNGHDTNQFSGAASEAAIDKEASLWMLDQQEKPQLPFGLTRDDEIAEMHAKHHKSNGAFNVLVGHGSTGSESGLLLDDVSDGTSAKIQEDSISRGESSDEVSQAVSGQSAAESAIGTAGNDPCEEPDAKSRRSSTVASCEVATDSTTNWTKEHPAISLASEKSVVGLEGENDTDPLHGEDQRSASSRGSGHSKNDASWVQSEVAIGWSVQQHELDQTSYLEDSSSTSAAQAMSEMPMHQSVEQPGSDESSVESAIGSTERGTDEVNAIHHPDSGIDNSSEDDFGEATIGLVSEHDGLSQGPGVGEIADASQSMSAMRMHQSMEHPGSDESSVESPIGSTERETDEHQPGSGIDNSSEDHVLEAAMGRFLEHGGLSQSPLPVQDSSDDLLDGASDQSSVQPGVGEIADTSQSMSEMLMQQSMEQPGSDESSVESSIGSTERGTDEVHAIHRPDSGIDNSFEDDVREAAMGRFLEHGGLSQSPLPVQDSSDDLLDGASHQSSVQPGEGEIADTSQFMSAIPMQQSMEQPGSDESSVESPIGSTEHSTEEAHAIPPSPDSSIDDSSEDDVREATIGLVSEHGGLSRLPVQDSSDDLLDGASHQSRVQPGVGEIADSSQSMYEMQQSMEQPGSDERCVEYPIRSNERDEVHAIHQPNSGIDNASEDDVREAAIGLVSEHFGMSQGPLPVQDTSDDLLDGASHQSSVHLGVGEIANASQSIYEMPIHQSMEQPGSDESSVESPIGSTEQSTDEAHAIPPSPDSSIDDSSEDDVPETAITGQMGLDERSLSEGSCSDPSLFRSDASIPQMAKLANQSSLESLVGSSELHRMGAQHATPQLGSSSSNSSNTSSLVRSVAVIDRSIDQLRSTGNEVMGGNFGESSSSSSDDQSQNASAGAIDRVKMQLGYNQRKVKSGGSGGEDSFNEVSAASRGSIESPIRLGGFDDKLDGYHGESSDRSEPSQNGSAGAINRIKEQLGVNHGSLTFPDISIADDGIKEHHGRNEGEHSSSSEDISEIVLVQTFAASPVGSTENGSIKEVYTSHQEGYSSGSSFNGNSDDYSEVVLDQGSTESSIVFTEHVGDEGSSDEYSEVILDQGSRESSIVSTGHDDIERNSGDSSDVVLDQGSIESPIVSTVHDSIETIHLTVHRGSNSNSSFKNISKAATDRIAKQGDARMTGCKSKAEGNHPDRSSSDGSSRHGSEGAIDQIKEHVLLNHGPVTFGNESRILYQREQAASKLPGHQDTERVQEGRSESSPNGDEVDKKDKSLRKLLLDIDEQHAENLESNCVVDSFTDAQEVATATTIAQLEVGQGSMEPPSQRTVNNGILSARDMDLLAKPNISSPSLEQESDYSDAISMNYNEGKDLNQDKDLEPDLSSPSSASSTSTMSDAQQVTSDVEMCRDSHSSKEKKVSQHREDKDARYLQEFQQLIEQAEKGEAIDEERLHFLQLYARQAVGEVLEKDEQLDFDGFLAEERARDRSSVGKALKADDIYPAENKRRGSWKETIDDPVAAALPNSDHGAPSTSPLTGCVTHTDPSSDQIEGDETEKESSAADTTPIPVIISILRKNEIDELTELLQRASENQPHDEDRLYELSLLYRWMRGEQLDDNETRDVEAFREFRKLDRKYKEEFKQLVEQLDAGDEVDEHRFYSLQLYGRRNLGDDLTDEELEYLEAFLTVEEAAKARKLALSTESRESSQHAQALVSETLPKNSSSSLLESMACGDKSFEGDGSKAEDMLQNESLKNPEQKDYVVVEYKDGNEDLHDHSDSVSHNANDEPDLHQSLNVNASSLHEKIPARMRPADQSGSHILYEPSIESTLKPTSGAREHESVSKEAALATASNQSSGMENSITAAGPGFEPSTSSDKHDQRHSGRWVSKQLRKSDSTQGEGTRIRIRDIFRAEQMAHNLDSLSQSPKESSELPSTQEAQKQTLPTKHSSRSTRRQSNARASHRPTRPRLRTRRSDEAHSRNSRSSQGWRTSPGETSESEGSSQSGSISFRQSSQFLSGRPPRLNQGQSSARGSRKNSTRRSSSGQRQPPRTSRRQQAQGRRSADYVSKYTSSRNRAPARNGRQHENVASYQRTLSHGRSSEDSHGCRQNAEGGKTSVAKLAGGSINTGNIRAEATAYPTSARGSSKPFESSSDASRNSITSSGQPSSENAAPTRRLFPSSSKQSAVNVAENHLRTSSSKGPQAGELRKLQSGPTDASQHPSPAIQAHHRSIAFLQKSAVNLSSKEETIHASIRNEGFLMAVDLAYENILKHRPRLAFLLSLAEWRHVHVLMLYARIFNCELAAANIDQPKEFNIYLPDNVRLLEPLGVVIGSIGVVEDRVNGVTYIPVAKPLRNGAYKPHDPKDVTIFMEWSQYKFNASWSQVELERMERKNAARSRGIALPTKEFAPNHSKLQVWEHLALEIWLGWDEELWFSYEMATSALSRSLSFVDFPRDPGGSYSWLIPRCTNDKGAYGRLPNPALSSDIWMIALLFNFSDLPSIRTGSWYYTTQVVEDVVKVLVQFLDSARIE